MKKAQTSMNSAITMLIGGSSIPYLLTINMVLLLEIPFYDFINR